MVPEFTVEMTGFVRPESHPEPSVRPRGSVLPAPKSKNTATKWKKLLTKRRCSMRFFPWLFTGVLALGAGATSWGQSWHRFYRPSTSYYTPNLPRTYTPSPYGYVPPDYRNRN